MDRSGEYYLKGRCKFFSRTILSRRGFNISDSAALPGIRLLNNFSIPFIEVSISCTAGVLLGELEFAPPSLPLSCLLNP